VVRAGGLRRLGRGAATATTRHARGLPAEAANAPAELQPFFEAQIRALSNLAEAVPPPEARARLLGTGLDGAVAFPTSEFAVMGPDGAVNIIFRKEIQQAGDDAEARRLELEADYRETFANPWKAAELGYIDEVIKPEETRPKVIAALEMLATKRDQNPPKKHGNIPL